MVAAHLMVNEEEMKDWLHQKYKSINRKIITCCFGYALHESYIVRKSILL